MFDQEHLELPHINIYDKIKKKELEICEDLD